MSHSIQITTSIRRLIIFFMIALVLSGITAFAIETELSWLLSEITPQNNYLHQWLSKVYIAVKNTNEQYPFISYGSDWLAFAHIVIATAFIGPLQDPVRNKWVIQFARIACLLVLPLAFIAGHIRQIPLFWQLIDCSFGVIGFIPLTVCYYKIQQLENIQVNHSYMLQ